MLVIRRRILSLTIKWVCLIVISIYPLMTFKQSIVVNKIMSETVNLVNSYSITKKHAQIDNEFVETFLPHTVNVFRATRIVALYDNLLKSNPDKYYMETVNAYILVCKKITDANVVFDYIGDTMLERIQLYVTRKDGYESRLSTIDSVLLTLSVVLSCLYITLLLYIPLLLISSIKGTWQLYRLLDDRRKMFKSLEITL